ncbi:hypothetical protein C5B42_05650 [Candidatus Cerribacteria bacterium 'Amazon FNV 2010 28 9']|uniref:Type II secretion system protein GspG C-terminal domain-containing protein n=1 Tax=Candidatus Cerribacteria bacterium 'Amazon FNV 2010 28 9' TaxID=2081795 RepID=A0A317JMK8_9BACT|nr:MAG: hypothetical protein C5B42_05650 [Candidatus Cerribacteria bacterium 'Amazon FNV 2010 28 9']
MKKRKTVSAHKQKKTVSKHPLTRLYCLLCDRGFTMIELLVALSIVAIMILLLALGQGLQLGRGEDAQRKSDFAKLKIAFEDYYNDHKCYPPPQILQQCNTTALAPYLGRVPCDPVSKQPYAYITDGSCRWYALFTTLDDTSDPDITTLGCKPTCGVTNLPYNYIQTNGAMPVGDIVNLIDGNTNLLPTPPPTVIPGDYACDPRGQCNVYDDPIGHGCKATFVDAQTCQSACANPANWCTR